MPPVHACGGSPEGPGRDDDGKDEEAKALAMQRRDYTE